LRRLALATVSPRFWIAARDKNLTV